MVRAGSALESSPKGSRSPSPKPSHSLGREEAAESPAEVRSAGATGDEQEVHPVAPAPISPKSPEQHVAPEVDVESAVGEEGTPGGASAVEAPALTPVDEASVAMAELMQTQGKTEEMRDEIHDIDLKLKKLKALMKGKGGDADAVVASVRQILGVHHEEEVKAPPAYHQMRKELKEQQDKVRILRKKWWDDHRDFDGLVEKVRNQMGGLHQLFSGPEGKLSLEAAAGGAASQFSDSDQAMQQGGSNRGTRARGSVMRPGPAGAKGKGSNKGRRMSAGLIGFGAGLKNMVDGPVQKSDSGAAPRKRFSIVKAEVEEARESRSLHSLVH